MKSTILLGASLLVLCSCKKEGHNFEYRAECTSCNVEYVNSDEAYSSQTIHGTWRFDSIYEGAMLLRVDTVDLPKSWSYSFDGEHDQTASIRMEHFSGARTPSTVKLFVDGIEDQSKTIVRDEVTIHN